MNNEDQVQIFARAFVNNTLQFFRHVFWKNAKGAIECLQGKQKRVIDYS